MVFFKTELQFLEGVPEVGNGRVQLQIAFEILQRGARLGLDPSADPITFALSQRASFVGSGLRFQRLPRVVELLDGSDPDGAHVEHLGDLATGQALGGECDDAMTKLDRERFHRRTLRGCRRL